MVVGHEKRRWHLCLVKEGAHTKSLYSFCLWVLFLSCTSLSILYFSMNGAARHGKTAPTYPPGGAVSQNGKMLGQTPNVSKEWLSLDKPIDPHI